MGQKSHYLLKKLFTISLLLVFSLPVIGQGQFRFYSDTSKNARNITLPILLYTPETQFAAGVLGVRLWKNLHPEIPTRTSNAELVLLYTSRGQLIIIPRYTIFTRGEKYLIEGFGEELINYRDYYFGIGNNTSPDSREKFTYDVLGWENRIGRRIFKHRKLFIGIETRALQYYNMRLEPGGALETEKLLATMVLPPLGLARPSPGMSAIT